MNLVVICISVAKIRMDITVLFFFYYYTGGWDSETILPLLDLEYVFVVMNSTTFGNWENSSHYKIGG